MGEKSRYHAMLPFLFGMITASGIFALYNAFYSISAELTVDIPETDTPGMDYIDAYTCAPAEDKIVTLRGKEDNFSRDGNEPASINPKLLESPYYRDLSNDRNKVHGFRDYDERGVDKFLFDYFNVPDGVVKGVLVLGARAQGNIDSDAVTLGDQFDDLQRPNYSSRYNFSVPLAQAIRDHGVEGHPSLVAIPLSAFKSRKLDGTLTTLKDYLKQPDRRKDIDFFVQDDAMIDFSALVLCNRPAKKKGTTFTEISAKLFGPDLSFLGCNINKSQPMCDPYAGDLLCSQKAPLGCYQDGSGRPPDALADDFPRRHFAGGTVRMTAPVRGDTFKTYVEAVEYCQTLFGPDWRVLNFHEAGGQAVVTISDIAVNSRVWVDVSDQSYSNCWSRD